jgi:hypothetical protein
MQFKTEVSLLLASITLFAVAMFFYSYQSGVGDSVFSLSLAYPYRGVALAFVGFGSVSMVTASISYSKRSKNLLQ